MKTFKCVIIVEARELLFIIAWNMELQLVIVANASM